jgi:biopolymer transport protein ExbB/TolQ
MPTIDRFIELLQSEQGERLVLENDQEVRIHHADGTVTTATDPLHLLEIRQMLEEVLPDHCRSSYEASDPLFCFPYSTGGYTGELEVSQTEGNIRVSVEPALPVSVADESASDRVTPEAEEAEPPPSNKPAGETEAIPEETTPPSRSLPLSANPDFPKVVPPSLRKSEARIRMIGGLVGLALGSLTSLIIFFVTRHDSLLGQMFDLRKVTTAIPVFISCLFFWSATICFLRWWRLRDLERISSKQLLLDATRLLSATTAQDLSKEFEGDSVQASPLLRRLQAVLRQWIIQPDLQDADLVLQQHAANDEETVHAGYSLVRTFVWALPVLGLIGTVIGISLAVGGFARFLRGDINDVVIIKENLVGVTAGLSFAFLITLQGLLTSLLVMLAASVLQTREEKLYGTIQHDLAEIFLPVLQRVEPESQPAPIIADLDAWRENLQRIAKDVLQVVETGGTKLMDVIDERERVHQEKVLLWTQTWDKVMDESAVRLGQVIDRVGGEVSTANGHLAEHLDGVREGLAEHAGVLRTSISAQMRASAEQERVGERILAQTDMVKATTETLVELTASVRSALECQMTLQSAMQQLGEVKLEQIEAVRIASNTLARLTVIAESTLENQTSLQTAMQQLKDLKSEQTDAVQETTKTLAKLSNMTRSALECQTTLQAAMHQLRELNWETTFAGYAEALSEQSREMRTTSEAVRSLALLTQEIQSAQTTLQTAISQLHATGFEQTLASFQDSLIALGPVLESFREPFAWRAVPMAQRASSND